MTSSALAFAYDGAVNFATPNATLVLPADAPREAWLEARTQGIGGSDVSAIVGLNKWASAYSVWLDKLKLAPPKPETMAMKMGNLLEPIVRELFTEASGLRVRQRGLLRSKSHPFMQYTPDGLTEDGGLLECKTSNGWLSHEWEDGQVPDHAELQVQHGMAVTGRTHAWVCGLLDGRDWFMRRIERDDDLITELIAIEERFWTQHVLTSEAPPAVKSDLELLKAQYGNAVSEPPATAPVAELAELREAHTSLGKQIKELEKERDNTAARIRQLAGDKELLAGAEDQRVYFTIKQNGAFSARKFEADHPELAAKYQKTVTQLDSKALQEAEPGLYGKYRARVLRAPALKDAK
ncbi:lambda-exonuclease family protein [Nesterenkonia rhizosphaerae]|uniref:YqaJ viral recombinase family protein n=1 Tax=Nesterenkonia rhizosphaerae TaxID=1348272 RepID=A0ABP9FRQ5_9MICC